jgi:serine/threonine-protein phosphatase 2A regulatory subunit B
VDFTGKVVITSIFKLFCSRLVLDSCMSNLSVDYVGHENYRSGSNEFSCNLSSKLLHLAWHPTTNFIACASGNSLLMYHA